MTNPTLGPGPRKILSPTFWILLSIVASALLVVSCGDRRVKEALDTDANGYFCPDCKTKFYTDREVFANRCPQCKQPNIQQVLGNVCAGDQHVTMAPRGRGAIRCEQCGKPTASLSIPRETDLKAWGAQKKSAAEVGV